MSGMPLEVSFFSREKVLPLIGRIVWSSQERERYQRLFVCLSVDEVEVKCPLLRSKSGRGFTRPAKSGARSSYIHNIHVSQVQTVL